MLRETDDRATLAETPPASVIKILNGAVRALGERGEQRLSMSDISHVSGVSRGTLYRYFRTKEDVLAAVSEYTSRSFENGVRDVARDIADPRSRLHAVLQFHNDYSAQEQNDRTLLVEPAFVLRFFQSHFARHKQAMLDALAPVFATADARKDEPVDRVGLVEMAIRLQVSRLILPVDADFDRRWISLIAAIETALGLTAPDIQDEG